MMKRMHVAGALLVAITLAACRTGFEFPGFDYNLATEVPDGGAVDAVVFLVGDAGATVKGRSPLLDYLKGDIEYWSGALARDSAVSVVFLGDNVYPSGVHDRGSVEFPQDSARLWNQIELVAGESALAHRTVGLFLTGNHDWGNMSGRPAARRVLNQEEELVQARETGPRVALLPPAGHPGPIIRDLRDNVRLVFIDSHWFLQDQADKDRATFFEDLQEALRSAGDREVIILAHHPFATAGPHGAVASGSRAFGMLTLLSRSGTLVQDLNSPVYGSFRDQMRVAFAETGRVPLVFAAGHDHSLQVLDGRREGDPRNILVSGAASKLTEIDDTLGMRYGAVRPGYMKLVFRKDDTVDLFVTAGDASKLLCPAAEEARTRCMAEAADSFRIVYSETLPIMKPPRTAEEITEDEAVKQKTKEVTARGAGGAASGTVAGATKAQVDSVRVERGQRQGAQAGAQGQAQADSVKKAQARAAAQPDTAKKVQPDTVKKVQPDTAKKVQPDTAQVEDEDDEDLDEIDPTPLAVPLGALHFGRDSVVARPGQSYHAGPIKRLFLGDLNRKLWDIEFTVPVLDLDSVGGGLTPVELSGGKQTLGLRLEGRDGMVYQFRSIVKDASRALPGMLQSTPVDDEMVQDQMGAQFPLSAAVVAELLEAAGVLVAKPTVIVMPDDPRLGEYRELFAGRMGWIEVRPNEREGDRPGFAGSDKVTGTDELFENLREEPADFVNERDFVRARLIDMFVNDWDRHTDNWRWASFDDSTGGNRWDPIPRDRDWALARVDGLLPTWAGEYYPKLVGFGDDYPDLRRLMWAGNPLDRRLLGGVGRDVFLEEATALQSAFTDSVIDAAIDVLPPEYRAVEEARLRRSFLARRAKLVDKAMEYYALLAKWVDLYGTLESDSLDITVHGDSMTVALWRGEDRVPGFRRTFRPAETQELRIYLLKGADVVTTSGGTLPIRTRMVGEPDTRLVLDGGVRVLDDQGNVGDPDGLSFYFSAAAGYPVWGLDADGELDEDKDLIEVPDPPVMAWESRDWGTQWIAAPAFDYQSEFGLHVGAKVTRYGFGFRKKPWNSKLEVAALAAMNPFRVVGLAEYERKIGLDGLSIRLGTHGQTERRSRFYGDGNETVDVEPEDFYTAFRSYLDVQASLAYTSRDERWSVWAGPQFVRWGALGAADHSLIFDTLNVYGEDAFAQIGAQAGFELDGRDVESFPTSGVHLLVEGKAYPKGGDLRAAYGGLRSTVTGYLSLPGPFDPAVHVRLYGESVWGDAPYPERAILGGKPSLPGYRSFRFFGDQTASLSSLLRLSFVEIERGGGVDVGAFGIGTVGRAWQDDAPDLGTLHYGWGGGLFVHSSALDKSLTFSMVRGDRNWRTYLGLGFPF